MACSPCFGTRPLQRSRSNKCFAVAACRVLASPPLKCSAASAAATATNRGHGSEKAAPYVEVLKYCKCQMRRQAKRDAAASNCLAPPSKKSVQAATEFSVASSRGIERPLRSCRVISAIQPAHSAPLPLPVLQTRPVKAEKLSSKAECTLSSCASTPKLTGKCHAAVDEHCPVSLCTHV